MPDIEPKVLLKFVDEKHLTAIGRVITQWSLLESILDCCIWQAGKLRNDMGRIICAQMQVASKLDVLQTMLDQKKPTLAKKFKPVANYVKGCLQGPRNVIAHGAWASIPPAGISFVTKFSARGKLQSQGGIKTVEELEQLAEDIAAVTTWLLALADQLPKLQERPGGLTRPTLDIPPRQDCPTQKTRALQPLKPRG